MSGYDLEVKIKEIIQRTYNVKSFRLDVGDKINYEAGQYLIVTLPEKDLSKPLSISSSPTERGYIEFTKKITDSEFSKTLDSLKPGDCLKIRYPFGKFTLRPEYSNIVFLSGGIGITPIKSMCKYVVDKKIDTDVVLLYGNRTMRDIVFKEDFELMQKQFPKLKVVHVLSEYDPSCEYRTGHITKAVIKEEVPDYIRRKFFICGPPPMVEAMKSILTDGIVISKENIITENFAGY